MACDVILIHSSIETESGVWTGEPSHSRLSLRMIRQRLRLKEGLMLMLMLVLSFPTKGRVLRTSLAI